MPKDIRMRTSIDELLKPGSTIDRHVEHAVFSSLKVECGIYKTTISGRLRDLDEACVAAWTPTSVIREIMDVGVSSGTTALEWLQVLQKAGHQPKMTATDISLRARLLEPWPKYKVLVSPGGLPLQHLLFGLPIRPWRRRLDYFSQNWIVIAAANLMFKIAVKSGAVAHAERDAVDIMLIAPQATANAVISFEDDDVFAPNKPEYKRRYDAVRAANLLTPGHFSLDLLRVGVANLKERLAGPGSLLIIARTHREEGGHLNHGTIFRLDGNHRLQIARRLHQGSEIEQLVLST